MRNRTVSASWVRFLAGSLPIVVVFLNLSCGGRDIISPKQVPATLAVVAQPALARDAQVFSVHPVVEVRDRAGRRVAGADQAVTAHLEFGTGSLTGATTVAALDGRATFADLGFAGEGPIRLRFEATSLTPALSDTIGIAANIVVADSTVLRLISDSIAEAAGTYTFMVSGVAPPIDSGQVLIGGEGDGFVRRVLNVTRNGPILTVQTGDVGLEDLGITGTYTDTLDITALPGSGPGTVTVPRNILSLSQSQRLPVTWKLNLYPIPLDNASISLTLPQLDVDFQPHVIRTLKFGSRAQLTEGSIEVTGTVTVTGQYAPVAVAPAQVSLAYQIPLPLEVPLPPITILGVPLPIPNRLLLALVLDTEIGAGGPVTSLFTVQATGTLGGKFVFAPGVPGLVPIASATFSANSVAVSDLHANWHLKFTPRVRVTWDIAKLGGPYISAGPYFSVVGTANQALQQHTIDCTWGGRADAGITLKLHKSLSLSASVQLIDWAVGPFCRQTFPFLTTGTITGTVTSNPGGGLAGITVTTSPGNFTATTTGAGDYTITRVPPGPVIVSLSGVPAGCTAPNAQTADVTAGGTATANFVVQCPPSIVLTATPRSISAGQSSTLTWSSTNATTCAATWTSSTAISGSQVVSPTTTTTYSILCGGSGGSAAASVMVTVNLLYTVSTSSSPNNGGSTSGGGTYTAGSSVTVLASAASGYAFVNWTENGSQVSSSATYTFTASANRSLVANFSANPLLTVTGRGTGSGSVTSNVSGINCSIIAGSASGNCSASFSSGTSVTLTATPVSGHTFTGWSGACAGTGSCQVTMTQVQSVIASFSAGRVTFAESIVGGLGPSDLYMVEIAVNGVDTRIGQIRTSGGVLPSVTDIALLPDSSLVGVSYADFYNIDRQSGLANLLGPVGRSDVNGLAASASGVLYASTSGGELLRRDAQRGWVSLGFFGGGLGTSGDLAFAPNGTLYGTLRTSSGVNVLASIDASTGAATVLSPASGLGFGNVWGLTFVASDLYGLTSDPIGPGTTGQLIRIDLGTGVATSIRPLMFGAGGAADRSIHKSVPPAGSRPQPPIRRRR